MDENEFDAELEQIGAAAKAKKAAANDQAMETRKRNAQDKLFWEDRWRTSWEDFFNETKDKLARAGYTEVIYEMENPSATSGFRVSLKAKHPVNGGRRWFALYGNNEANASEERSPYKVSVGWGERLDHWKRGMSAEITIAELREMVMTAMR